MVIGPDSVSFLMLRQLVQRLPAMVGPKWINTRTQPIAAGDVVRLANLATIADPPAHVQLGGRDVISYGEIMPRFARADGRRAPLIVPVPVRPAAVLVLGVGLCRSSRIPGVPSTA